MSLLEEVQEALADHYRVVGEIGRGGMATVYRAEDVRHGRSVAVKVLSPDLAASIGADRFLREISIATRLQHPHILPLYDSGQSNGLLWYVMPFVAGESLRARITREGQLGIDDAIGIAAEAADALGYAHQQGIVHRDVKPENILLQDGHAMLADFGIARAISAAESEKLTMTGMSVGTAGYMSPEQFGGTAVDGRADVYSLGCVLYEMLVGQPPFTGANPMAVMARATMEPPPAISVVRGTVPPHVELAVIHALQKVAADRFASMEEFKRALLGDVTSTYAAKGTMAYTAAMVARRAARPPWHRAAAAITAGVVLLAGGLAWWGNRVQAATGPVALAGTPMASAAWSDLAVLYFDDRSPDGRLRYMADGVTEALIDQLALVPALDVVSANGVRGFRGREVSSDSVARALDVGAVVRGAVSPLGDGVRIDVELRDAASDAPLGGRSMRFTAAQMGNVGDSVAAEVASYLRERLGQQIRLRAQQGATTNLEAWTLVQRAEKRRKDADSLLLAGAKPAADAALAGAEMELARAAALDSRWAEPAVRRAFVALGRAQLARGDEAAVDAAVAHGVAQADQAIALDPRNADAHEARGQLLFYQLQQHPTMAARESERLLADAEGSLQAAVTFNRQQAGAWATLSSLHYRKPDLQAASIAALNAYEADAYLTNARAVVARLLSVSYDLEQYNEAKRWCDTGARRFPQDRLFTQCKLYLMWMHAAQGRAPDSAWVHAARLVELTPAAERPMMEKLSRALVAGALARGGLADSARAVLRTARADAALDPHREVAGTEAVVRVILGDHDEAVAQIKDYLTANPSHRKGFATRTGWWWRDLQTHSGFRALLAGAR